MWGVSEWRHNQHIWGVVRDTISTYGVSVGCNTIVTFKVSEGAFLVHSLAYAMYFSGLLAISWVAGNFLGCNGLFVWGCMSVPIGV